MPTLSLTRVCLLIPLFWGAGADTKPPKETTLTGVPVTKHLDVAYGAIDPKYQKLDAYLVKAGQPTPVLIEVHGGGFRKGSKSSGADATSKFFARDWVYMKALRSGISVISIDYRLTPKYRFPAQGEDVARAVQFVRTKAKEWNIDPSRIALCGTSAGGHLSLWVGLHDDLAKPLSHDAVERESTRVRAIVDISGPVDFSRFNPEDLSGDRKGLAQILVDFVGCSADDFNQTQECRNRVREASPIHLATPDDPPVMLVYMDRDGKPNGLPPVFLDNPHSAWFGVLMAEALSKQKVPRESLIGRRTSRRQQADAIIRFLENQLKRDDSMDSSPSKGK